MTKIKPGLGRGLDALMNPNLRASIDNPISMEPKRIQTDDGQSFNIIAKIPVLNILPNPYQPRRNFDIEALDELKKSILKNGLIQPITIRRTSANQYELISGERRLRACKEIGYTDIPAYIIKVETKEAMLALSLIENIQREKLNPIEVAEAYHRLMNECNLSQEEIAERVGKNRTTITNSIRLLKLPKKIQDSLIKKEITAGHARALINLPSEKIQLQLLKKIIKNNLSVRKVEIFVRNLLNDKVKKSKSQMSETLSIKENVTLRHWEDKLQRIFGTKVRCKQKKDGVGEIILEFYSNEEFERLLELIEVIEKPYN